MKRKGILKIAAIVLAVLLVAAIGFVVALPTIVRSWKIPTMTWDLSTVSPSLTNQTATAHVAVTKASYGGCDVRVSGRVAGLPYTLTVKSDFDWSWTGPSVKGVSTLSIEESRCRLKADFSGKSTTSWRAKVELEPVRLNEADPLIHRVFELMATNLLGTCQLVGDLSLKVVAASTKKVPVPTWKASLVADAVNASFAAGENPFEIRGLRLLAGVNGVGSHVDIQPLRPMAANIEVGGFSLTNVHATVFKDDKRYLVTEAGAGCCGGSVRLYSLFLNPESLNAGVTLFLDDIEAGEVLKRLKGFKGAASGRLHGKLPLTVLRGKKLRFKTAYLYSTPGETGKLQLEDAAPITDNLTRGGVSENDCRNVARALKNLDYSVLKFDLKPEDLETNMSALALKIEGSSTVDGQTVPVSVGVTFHGNFEELINMGLRARSKVK